METRKQSGRELISLESENGYVMLSTLLLLVLTGIFLQGVIKISTNYIVQLNQLSSAYQAKTALNMSEKLLNDYIVENNNQLPELVSLSSSVGEIKIIKNTSNSYVSTIIQPNGVEFNKKIEIEVYEIEDKEVENNVGKIDTDPLVPMNKGNIYTD